MRHNIKFLTKRKPRFFFYREIYIHEYIWHFRFFGRLSDDSLLYFCGLHHLEHATSTNKKNERKNQEEEESQGKHVKRINACLCPFRLKSECAAK